VSHTWPSHHDRRERIRWRNNWAHHARWRVARAAPTRVDVALPRDCGFPSGSLQRNERRAFRGDSWKGKRQKNHKKHGKKDCATSTLLGTALRVGLRLHRVSRDGVIVGDGAGGGASGCVALVFASRSRASRPRSWHNRQEFIQQRVRVPVGPVSRRAGGRYRPWGDTIDRGCGFQGARYTCRVDSARRRRNNRGGGGGVATAHGCFLTPARFQNAGT
jgi:hypothetical protein